MQQLVCAVGAETDLIMCAENRWPNLSLEMQLPMRDLSYPPWSVKVGTGGQYGVGVNRQGRPPQPRRGHAPVGQSGVFGRRQSAKMDRHQLPRQTRLAQGIAANQPRR